MKVGEAAKANAFDWESPILDPFRKNFLEVLYFSTLSAVFPGASISAWIYFFDLPEYS